MTIILPGVVPSASGWQVIDYATAQAATDPAAAGVAIARLPQLAGDEMWLVDHAVVACNSSTPTAVRWYATSITPGALLDGSHVGNFDVADWPSGLVLRPSQTLVVVWEGASDDAVGTVSIQYRLLRR